MPRHPLAMARLGLAAVRPARMLARTTFRGERARALFAGIAAHSFLPLDAPLTASFGVVLAVLGHVVGWPLPRGGSQGIADALASRLRSLGGAIETARRVRSLAELPASRAYLCDITPAQLERIAGDRLSSGYRAKLRGYRRGAGVFKVDYALDGPIPWRAPEGLRAGTGPPRGAPDGTAGRGDAGGRGPRPRGAGQAR